MTKPADANPSLRERLEASPPLSLHLTNDVLTECQSRYFPGAPTAQFWQHDPAQGRPYYRVVARDEFEAALVLAVQPPHIDLDIVIR